VSIFAKVFAVFCGLNYWNWLRAAGNNSDYFDVSLTSAMVVRAPLDFYWKWGELDLHNQQYRFVIKNFIRAE